MPTYRSKLELNFAQHLAKLNLPVLHETNKFEYIKTHTYTPDFKLTDNIFIETKGLFSASDRTKMLLTREQNPHLIFILVFQVPGLKLSKKSKTSYAQWCDKHGFLWCAYADTIKFESILQQLGILPTT